jgi:amino acid transporter
MIIATFAALAVSQLGASRTLWSMARDREIPLHRWFAKLSAGERLPVNALIVVGILAAILPFILTTRTAYVLGGSSTVPLLLALLLPVIGLWRVRRRGEWLSETPARARWLSIGIVVAGLTLAALAVDVAWPHEELYLTGFSAWRPVIILAVIFVSGFALMARSFRQGGMHVRNHGHVDRDFDQRIAIAHTGTCVTCHKPLAKGDEVLWNSEAHATRCLACGSAA